MQKTALALLFAGFAASAFATDFAQEHTLTINGAPAYLAETSARVLANKDFSAPELVDDITDGLGKQKIPGYKIMVMGRTYSVTAETKPPKEGQTQWRETAYVHRGIKLFIGVPVVKGKADIAHARLLNIGVVDDDGGSAPHSAEDKIRPVGKQLMSKEAKVENPVLRIRELELPNMKKGEASGGVGRGRDPLPTHAPRALRAESARRGPSAPRPPPACRAPLVSSMPCFPPVRSFGGP